MKRKSLVLLALASFSLSASARQTPSDTLRIGVGGAIERALLVSPDILASESRVDFADARLDLAKASRFLPEFRATSAHAMAPGIDNPNGQPFDRLYLDPSVRNDWEDLSPYNRIEVQAVQPLFTWGEINRSVDAARHGVEAERQAVRTNRIQVAVRTGELWYGIVLARALEQVTDMASDVVDRARREIRKLLDDGDPDVDDADLFQVEITGHEVTRRVVEIRERLAIARSGLARQLMLPDGVVPEPDRTTLDPLPFVLDSLERYLDLALQQRPEPARAEAGIAARQAMVQVARSAYFPKLFLGVEARYSHADGRYRQLNPFVSDPFLSRSVRAGFGMRLDLGFPQTRARVEQARAQLDEVFHQSEAARQIVRYEAESAWHTVRIRKAAVDAVERSLHLSKEWLSSEQVNFDYDLGDTENLVDAVRVNLELQAARHQAVFDYNVAVLRLLAAVGLLDQAAEFGIILD